MEPGAPGYQSKRQVTCMRVPVARLVGNGNPHQNYQHIQIILRIPWEAGNKTGSKGQTVCIKYMTAMTIYTVNEGSDWACHGATVWDPENIIIWSSNKNNKGVGLYCGLMATEKYQGERCPRRRVALEDLKGLEPFGPQISTSILSG